MATAAGAIARRWHYRGHRTPKRINRARCDRCGTTMESERETPAIVCRCGALAINGGHNWVGRGFIGEPCFTDLCG